MPAFASFKVKKYGNTKHFRVNKQEQPFAKEDM